MARKGLILIISFIVGLFLSIEAMACCGGPKLDGITLKIEGALNEEDVERLQASLGGIYAVKDVHYHPETGLLTISLFSEMVTEEELISCLNREGFKASLPGTLYLRTKGLNPEGLELVKVPLNNLPGVIVDEINAESGRISLSIYKPWVRDNKKILDVFKEVGLEVELPCETFVFQTSGMTEVDAFDVRAYLRLSFGVVSAELELDTARVWVTIYKDWLSLEDVISTIEERGFTKVIHTEVTTS